MAIKLGQNTQQQSTGGGVNLQNLQQVLGKAAALKGQYSAAFDILKQDPSGLGISTDEQKIKLGRERAERIINQLEDYYFKNKLHKGMSLDGVTTMVTGSFDRNNPYYRFKRAITASRVGLARAAGDVGNLALQEQMAQEKLIPDALYDRNTAIEQFTTARQLFGLKPRRRY